MGQYVQCCYRIAPKDKKTVERGAKKSKMSRSKFIRTLIENYEAQQ